MKFKYNLDQIVRALDYNDLKGLCKLIDRNIFAKQEPSVTKMEEVFKNLFLQMKDKEKRDIERLMLGCARYNSIGY